MSKWIGHRETTRVRISVGLAVLTCMWLILPSPAIADAPGPEELKAAFIFRFSLFVKWPPDLQDSESAFRFCVLNSSSYSDALERVTQGKTVFGRPIEIRSLDKSPDSGECNLLFIAAAMKERVGAVLDKLRGQPILTIGEQEGFARRGGIIDFKWKNDQLRFEVNRAAADHSGLQIGSKILRLAEIVDGKGKWK